MGSKEFIKFAKGNIVKYFNKRVDVTDNKTITTDDVFVVWYCKTLQNHKALLSTTVPDGCYYETYFDIYKKWENVCVKDGE